MPRAVWRYLATHPLTGDLIADDLPLSQVTITRRLSGPWGMSATIEPEYARMLTDTGSRLLDEWRASVWAECNGRIRGGGLLDGSRITGPSWAVTVDGYARYPHGIPYLDHFKRHAVDPLDCARELWRHLQSYPDGNLRLVLDDTVSPVRLATGSETKTIDTSDGRHVEFQEPDTYELAPWDAHDCGDEFDTLAKETPFEYLEDHQWADGDTIAHRLRLGYPGLGRRRTDIAFVEGENISAFPEDERDGDEFAQYVVGLGAGEGKTRLRTGQVGSADGRVRRVKVMERNDVTDIARLGRLSAAFQRSTRRMGTIPAVSVIDHPNAPLGAWEIGDEVQIALRSWGGETAWCRIVQEDVQPAQGGEYVRLTFAPAAG